MFRTSFLSGFVRLGTFAEVPQGEGDWLKVTAYIDDAASTIDDAVQFRTKKGTVVDVTNESLWKTRNAAELRAGVVVRGDGRRSENAVKMSLLTDTQLITTNKNGKRNVGRTYTTTALMAYALTWSDADYKGETQADRVKDAGIIRAFLDAQTN